MPLYEMYEDDTTNAEGGLAVKTENDEDLVISNELDREVPSPEVNDNYVNSSVMLPRGNSYDIWKVIEQKRDADENTVGKENDNPILDTQKYRVEFDDGEVSELT